MRYMSCHNGGQKNGARLRGVGGDELHRLLITVTAEEAYRATDLIMAHTARGVRRPVRGGWGSCG